MIRRFFMTALMIAAMAITALVASPLVAQDSVQEQQAGRVSVTLQDPAGFTDLEPPQTGAVLVDLLERAAARRLSAGQTLDIVITDVDLAGGYPVGVPHNERVRELRATFPPRIDLRFTLTDAQGNILGEGERTLRDLSYLMRPRARHDPDPLIYERMLLQEWLAEEFG